MSLYGISTYPASTQGKDQYSGNSRRSKENDWWHDWTGESFVWRLLHAAGRLSICSA
jgi:hypothetical protein